MRKRLPVVTRFGLNYRQEIRSMGKPASLFDIQDNEAEERALLEGEAQLDAGKSIPWKDVKRWLESWGKADELPPPTCK